MPSASPFALMIAQPMSSQDTHLLPSMLALVGGQQGCSKQSPTATSRNPSSSLKPIVDTGRTCNHAPNSLALNASKRSLLISSVEARQDLVCYSHCSGRSNVALDVQMFSNVFVAEYHHPKCINGKNFQVYCHRKHNTT